MNGRTGHTVHTDRGDVTAPLIVDCPGLAPDAGRLRGLSSRPTRRSRGLEVHPGRAANWQLGSDRSIVPAGYGWSFPAGDELRIGVGSFDPRFHVKDNTVKLAEDLGSEAVAPTRATGSPTGCVRPWRMRCSSPATRPGIACR